MHNQLMDSEWFKSRKKALRVTDAELAEALGVERSVANKIVNGKVAFNARRADRVAQLLKVGRDEILYRAGLSENEPKRARPLDIEKAPDQMPTRGAYDDVGAVKLKCLNLELAMGDGTNLADWFEETDVAFDANWLSAVSSSPFDRLVIGRGVGDSMRPTIGDQDDVLIDLNENELKKGDRIYAITIDGAGAVKRLMPSPDQGMIEVVSDNPDHPARVRTYPKPMIEIIGRVVWSGRRH